MTKIERKTIEIDAAGKAVGRVATEVAKMLQGKHKANYAPYIDGGDMVVINHAGKVKFTGRKLAQKDFYHHTMYPGGIKRAPMKHVFEKDPRKVMIHAIYGMLPKNRLREKMMQRLTINV